MQEKIKFGSWEAICLLVAMMGTKVILNYPRVAAELAGTAGWIQTLYIVLLATVAFFFIAKLYSRFEGKDLIDISQYLGGSILRIIIGVFVIAFLLFITVSLLRLFGEQMKTLAYVASPISYILVFFLAGMIVVGYFGLEPLVRFMAILVPVSIGAFLIYLVLLAPFYRAGNLFPAFGNGLDKIFIAGIPRISEVSELLFLFLIPPFIGSQKNFKSVGYISLGMTAFFLTSLTMAYICVVPYPAALESSLPAYDIGRIINYGRFFQRIEPLFIITWATMAFMYLSAAFYFTIYTFQKTFKLEHRQPLVLAFAVLTMTICLLPRSLMENIDLLVNNFRFYSGLMTFGVTILLLLAANMKKRRAEPRKC
ncbi:MAG: spore germination protein [Clostridia bacterium]|nr:spore germination protein [Clostridia bacterium]